LHKLALKLYDNQSDVNLSVRQYTQLVSQDKVDFFAGTVCKQFRVGGFGRVGKIQDSDASGRRCV
jgi:hypothetical protein